MALESNYWRKQLEESAATGVGGAKMRSLSNWRQNSAAHKSLHNQGESSQKNIPAIYLLSSDCE